MRVFVHRVQVEVVSTDPNPASVAMTLASTIAGQEPKEKGIVRWSADVLDNVPRLSATIPDRPTGTVQQDDEWFNDWVQPLLGTRDEPVAAVKLFPVAPEILRADASLQIGDTVECDGRRGAYEGLHPIHHSALVRFVGDQGQSLVNIFKLKPVPGPPDLPLPRPMVKR
jgi:hypothetical protein